MKKTPLRAVATDTQGENPPTRRSLRILIADDDRDGATLLSVLLKDEGHEVNTVLRGDEVLELVRLMRPDVCILDVNMPGLSGYAVAREIRERSGVVGPLLIAISGVWTKTSERLLGMAVGFDHYLVKPYDPNQLMALLEPLRKSAAGSARTTG